MILYLQIQGLRKQKQTQNLECVLGTKWTLWDKLSKLYEHHVCEELRASREPEYRHESGGRGLAIVFFANVKTRHYISSCLV